MKTILIVDDDVCIRDMLQEVLAKEGFLDLQYLHGRLRRLHAGHELCELCFQ